MKSVKIFCFDVLYFIAHIKCKLVESKLHARQDNQGTLILQAGSNCWMVFSKTYVHLEDRVLLCMRSDRFTYIICPNWSVFFAISCGILGNSAESFIFGNHKNTRFFSYERYGMDKMVSIFECVYNTDAIIAQRFMHASASN